MRRSSASCAAVILGLLAAILWLPREALAEKRVALIIGNSTYQKVPQLTNPGNDANDVAASFERLGFTVRKLLDARYEDMRRALLELGREARNADMAVVFFSGHGIEIGGQNWLIPVDAELRADTDVENEALSLNSIMLQVSTAKNLGLVILDACRNNPFAAKMAFSTRTRVVARGLARTEPNENVLVAFAAKDGTTASDGDGRNSPFTGALLKNLEQPGLEITFMFRNVRDAVMAATRREQQPFVYGSLSKDAIYLKDPPAPTPVAPAATTAPAVSALPTPDELLWAAIRDAKAPGLFEEFLNRFPSSRHAAEARTQLEELRKLALVSPPTAPAAPRAGIVPAPDDDADLPQAGGLFTSQDAARIAAIMTKHQLIMPKYRINRPSGGVPERFRKFVGVWASRVGYNGGRGRQVTLIVTDVDDEGLARGYYAFGPPTPTSTPGPGNTWNFAGKIENDVLTFSYPNSDHRVRPAASGALLLRSHLKRQNLNPVIILEPVWRLTVQERAAKR